MCQVWLSTQDVSCLAWIRAEVTHMYLSDPGVPTLECSSAGNSWHYQFRISPFEWSFISTLAPLMGRTLEWNDLWEVPNTGLIYL